MIVAMLAIGASVGAQDVLMFDSGPLDQIKEVDVIGLDPLNVGPVVANAPYSAEAVTEFTQALADGNRIERRTAGRVARNSQGRVRREQPGIAFGSFVADDARPIVTITDPRTGSHLTLNYDLKVAFRTTPPRMMFRQRADPASGGGVVFESMSSAGGGFTIARGSAIATPPAETIRVDPPMDVGPLPMTSPAVQMMAGRRFDGDVNTEQLEPREIEGLRAEGTRTTMTIPSGSMGNVLPIEIVSERWFSPELQVVLLTKRSDPRFGETIYRLTNIDRAEPPPDLFKVPDGFRTEEMKPGLMLPPKPFM